MPVENEESPAKRLRTISENQEMEKINMYNDVSLDINW